MGNLNLLGALIRSHSVACIEEKFGKEEALPTSKHKLVSSKSLPCQTYIKNYLVFLGGWRENLLYMYQEMILYFHFHTTYAFEVLGLSCILAKHLGCHN